MNDNRRRPAVGQPNAEFRELVVQLVQELAEALRVEYGGRGPGARQPAWARPGGPPRAGRPGARRAGRRPARAPGPRRAAPAPRMPRPYGRGGGGGGQAPAADLSGPRPARLRRPPREPGAREGMMGE
jgi:hypothetical protein